jgi:hypothetical protein
MPRSVRYLIAVDATVLAFLLPMFLIDLQTLAQNRGVSHAAVQGGWVGVAPHIAPHMSPVRIPRPVHCPRYPAAAGSDTAPSSRRYVRRPIRRAETSTLMPARPYGRRWMLALSLFVAPTRSRSARQYLRSGRKRKPADVLREARQRQSREKRERLIAAVDAMVERGDDITFVAVEKAAEVSRWLVYQPGLADYIRAAMANNRAAMANIREAMADDADSRDAMDNDDAAAVEDCPMCQGPCCHRGVAPTSDWLEGWDNDNPYSEVILK